MGFKDLLDFEFALKSSKSLNPVNPDADKEEKQKKHGQVQQKIAA